MTDRPATAIAGFRACPARVASRWRGPKPVTIDRVVWGRDREEAYRDRLATEYYIEAALEPSRWQVVASSTRSRAL